MASRLGCVTGIGKSTSIRHPLRLDGSKIKYLHPGRVIAPSVPTPLAPAWFGQYRTVKISTTEFFFSIKYLLYLSHILGLASHCRILLYDRPKHKLLYRWLGLYPLYFLAEVAIIATDLAELLGSAIALVLLFPSLELWHGVLITGFDVFLILGLRDPLRGRPVRFFELLIAAMVCRLSFCRKPTLLIMNRFIGSRGSHLYDRHHHKGAS